MRPSFALTYPTAMEEMRDYDESLIGKKQGRGCQSESCGKGREREQVPNLWERKSFLHPLKGEKIRRMAQVTKSEM